SPRRQPRIPPKYYPNSSIQIKHTSQLTQPNHPKAIKPSILPENPMQFSISVGRYLVPFGHSVKHFSHRLIAALNFTSRLL
ncbi:hypothetical protein, partial [Teichococcus vastitatis]